MESLQTPSEETPTSPSKSIKTKVVHTLKKGDAFQLNKLYELHRFDPTEDYSPNGSKWTCLHYASCFDSIITLDYILKLTYQTQKENYIESVNGKTAEGWTPLMIAVIYDKPDAVNLLIKYGGIRLQEQDAKELRAKDLALKYKREKIFKTLQKTIDLYPQKEGLRNETPLNTDSLAHKEEEESETTKEENFEGKQEFQELLLKGKRVPCQVCMGSNGRLKFTLCCGEPVHISCAKTLTKCVFCGEKKVSLGVDLKVPEKALTMS